MCYEVYQAFQLRVTVVNCVNGVINTDPFVISSTLNDYFCEVGHNLNLNFHDNNYFERYLPVRDFECFSDLEPATLPEIKDILLEFDDLSSGCDEVLASMFKNIFNIVGNLILHICNRNLAGGVFPNRLMLGLVVLIFKVSDPTLLTTYRPISLLNVISKLVEKLVQRRTLNILTYNNVLSDDQFVIRHNRSTEQAIHNFVNLIYQSKDRGEYYMWCVVFINDVVNLCDDVNESDITLFADDMTIGCSSAYIENL